MVSGEWSDHVFGRTPALVSTEPGLLKHGSQHSRSVKGVGIKYFLFSLTSAPYVLCNTRNKVLLKLEGFMVSAKQCYISEGYNY